MPIQSTHKNSAPRCAWPWPKQEKPPVGEVEFSYNSQDSTVFSPTTVVVSNVGKGPSVERHIVVNFEKPLQAENGKYVYPASDERFHVATAFAAADKTISFWQNAVGHPLEWSWSPGGRLDLHADQGDSLNAHYSPGDGSINFSHFTDPVSKKVIFTGDSGEVVSHEAGHAVLDGFRPKYLTAWSPDTQAFHESFGDVTALLVSLTDPRVVDRLVQQTGGDLRKPNLLAEMGEELGITINHARGKNVTGGDYTRTAINHFTWREPSQLPEKPPSDQLGRGPHSYSRLFTGAVYDLLTGLCDANLAQGQGPAQAIGQAAQELTRLYAGLMDTAPQGDFVYQDMAQALLAADAKYNAGHAQELLERVFSQRKILTTRASSWTQYGETRSLTVKLEGKEFGLFQGAQVSNPVDGTRSRLAPQEQASKLKQDLKDLIQAGRILYTQPGQGLTKADLVDAEGLPYAGVVRWLDGKMCIERVRLLS